MTISRRALFGKLDLTLFRSIESATAFAKLRGNPYVELVHWLHQLLQANDSDLHRICRHYQISSEQVERDMASALAMLPAGASSLSDFSHPIGIAVEQAWILSSLEFGGTCIRSGWLLAALVKTPELRRLLLGISPSFQSIPVEQLADSLPAIIDGSPEAKEGPYDGAGMSAASPGEASRAMAQPGDGRSALARYCTDLTAQARTGDIDPVIGRSHEIRTMVDILLRRRQNNPLLTGEAGVGKTAVVEGLALAIARGDVPPPLQDVRLLSLDVGALLAGASMRGEFESRLKALLEEAGHSAQPIILFVDEVHTLIGAGGQAGTGDAANLLKPALARGTLRTVGATTWSEYKRHIEKDPALTRRFQVLQVMEPQEASAVDMVRGLVGTFTRHHGVDVLDEAVRAAVVLSHRYIPSRQLPDKAISLLDTACARVAMSQHSPPAAVEHAGGRSNHLVLDDTEKQIQVQLKSDHQSSSLNLGKFTRIEDNAGRKDPRGQGFELRTDGHGVLRAKDGMLITTEARANAQSHALDSGETLARLTESREQHESLSEAALKAEAHQTGDQDEVAKAIKAQNDAIKGGSGNRTEGEFPELSAPHLVLASPAGIETTTLKSTHIASGEHIALTSALHTSFSAARSLLASAKEAIRLFAYNAGIKLVSAHADIDIVALKKNLRALANENIDITSVTAKLNLLAKVEITVTSDKITIAAKKQVEIIGGTSGSCWDSSGIRHKTKGEWVEHAGTHGSQGPASMPMPPMAFPALPTTLCKECVLKAAKAGSPVAAVGG